MFFLFKFFLIFKLLLLSFNAYTAEDPFSRSFTVDQGDINEIQNQEIQNNEKKIDDSVHPLIRYDLNKYFVKGVVKSELGSLVIVSFPEGTDYIMFLGDPLGNNMHVISEIKLDFIILSSSDGDKYKISVMNNKVLFENKQGINQ